MYNLKLYLIVLLISSVFVYLTLKLAEWVEKYDKYD